MHKILIIFIIILILSMIVAVGAVEQKRKKIEELNTKLLRLESRTNDLIKRIALMIEDLNKEETVNLCSSMKDKSNG